MLSDPENPRVFTPNYYANITNLSYNQTPLAIFHFAANTFIFTLSFTFNVLLIFLVLKKTPKAFKEYSQLLFISACINLLHSTTGFLTQFVSF